MADKINLLKEILDYSKNKNRFCLGNNGKKVLNRNLTKYMTIDAFKACIDFSGKNGRKTIQFVEPYLWDDEFEQRFYTANYKNVTKDNNTHPHLYACCFSSVKKSYAAWKVFADNTKKEEGLCVKILIDRKKFSKQLCKFESRSYKVYEGLVDYSLSDEAILHLHERNWANGNPNFYHDIFFNKKFELATYLSLLLIKRDIFDYEEELRYFLIPTSPKKDNKIYPEIDWGYVIKDVEVDIHYPNDKFYELRKFCYNGFGKSFLVHKVDLNSMPGGGITIQ